MTAVSDHSASKWVTFRKKKLSFCLLLVFLSETSAKKSLVPTSLTKLGWHRFYKQPENSPPPSCSNHFHFFGMTSEHNAWL